jgi:hypothetical protein
MRRTITTAVAAAASVLAACSSGGTPGAMQMKENPPAPMKAPYPDGPYGNKVDEPLADFNVNGYRLSTETADWTDADAWATDIKLSEYLHGVAPNEKRECKCLLITWGAGWCGACQQEQPALKNDINNEDGFCVLNIMQEGNQQGPLASRADVDAWVKRYQQNFYVVQGNAYTKNLWKGHARNGVISLPFNFIVKPSTMKVLEVVQGYRKDIASHSMGLCAD